ncbi:hypothetical protein JFL47_06530 [Haemophilus haemoglobinophilus]|nr:hypothetical protein [Canicola haemoglobinophilus]MBN6710883.1 hypothetical protein [Canicola haemoglobinophilus]
MNNIFKQLREQLNQTALSSGLHYLARLNDVINEIAFLLNKRNKQEVELICSLTYQLIDEYQEKNQHQDIQDDIALLQQVLDDFEEDFSEFGHQIENLQVYEFMAGLSLNFLQQALEYLDKEQQQIEYEDYIAIGMFDDLMEASKQLAVEASLKATLAIQVAKQQKLATEFSQKQQHLIHQTRIQTLSQRSQQGLNKRHRVNREVKKTFLEEYQKEYEKAQKTGVTLSKNKFAQEYSNKYGYQISTLRKWLKNV